MVIPDGTADALFELAFKMESNRREALDALARAGQLAQVYLGGYQSNQQFKWVRQQDSCTITTINGEVEPPKVGAE